MAIREVVQTETPGAHERRHRLVRVMITEDQDIYATWAVVHRNGKQQTVTTQVSPALKDLIIARVTFQNALQQIADDTYPRTGV